MQAAQEAPAFPTHPSLLTPARPARACAAEGCDAAVFGERFCNGCFADAAKDCARQIEAELITGGFLPGSAELKAALVGYTRGRDIRTFESSSILGELGVSEACYLRALTDSACLLLSTGGVAALRNLPGTRRLPEVTVGRLDFRALPQWDVTEPSPRDTRHLAQHRSMRRFQAACAAVMALIIVVLVLG